MRHVSSGMHDLRQPKARAAGGNAVPVRPVHRGAGRRPGAKAGKARRPAAENGIISPSGSLKYRRLYDKISKNELYS